MVVLTDEEKRKIRAAKIPGRKLGASEWATQYHSLGDQDTDLQPMEGPGENPRKVFKVRKFHRRRIANDGWGMAAGKTVGLVQGDLDLALGIKGSAVRCRRQLPKADHAKENNRFDSSKIAWVYCLTKEKETRKKLDHPNPCTLTRKETKLFKHLFFPTLTLDNTSLLHLLCGCVFSGQ